MNELKSYTEYAVSTPTADFVIGFDFNYGEDAVNVTVDNVPATEAGYTVVYLNETTIRLSPSVPSGIVRLQRETDIDQTDHAYRAGAKFIAQTMDENFEQLRHSQQEVRDGFYKLSDDTYAIIDTLEDVAQSAQEAADDANAAAQVANDAAAQVADKVSQSELDAAVSPLERYTPLPYKLQHYAVGQRVTLSTGEIVENLVPNNNVNPNTDMLGWRKGVDASDVKDESGLSQQVINNKLSQLVITPEYFGAVAGESDSSAALNAAIVFCSSNNYVLDGRGKSYNANSLVLKDNTHIKHISINSNLYDTMNSVITTDYGTLAPLKNITLDTVYIDGNRELHTNVGTTMDGGRCAVLIRRPIDGLRIINSKLNNAVTDGLMLFPVDWAITESNWFSFIKNVQVINTELQWNGRWGCSGDSVDGLLFDNVKAKFNGLDVAGGGDYTTGKSARLIDGTKHYGGAIAIEEYHGFSYSKNMVFRGGDYTKNAASSLVMQRTGAITNATRNITLDNLYLDFGSLNEAAPNKSMIIGGYSTTNTTLSYRNLVVNNCNLGNGIAEFIGCNATYLSELFDVEGIILTSSIVNSDKYYNYTLSDSYSNFYTEGYALKDKDAYFIGYNNQETTVNFFNESVIGKSTSLNIFDGGAIKSGLRFTKQDAGYDMHFLNGVNAILTVRKYGSIIPAVDNIAQIGESNHRFSRLFAHTMSLSSLGVFSDNTTAKNNGLQVGDFYRTSTGQVMVVF